MAKEGIKKIGYELDQNTWEAINLIKMNTNISIKAIIGELITKYILSYAKEKNISRDTLALIEKKLKATE